MASTEDLPSQSHEKLPLLHLLGATMSAANGAKERDYQARASRWAATVRQRITTKMKDGEKPEPEDLQLLIAELIGVFGTVLQKNNRNSWLFLYEVLSLIQPYSDYLNGKEVLLRYLEGIYIKYQTNQTLLSDIDILGAMDKAFPKDTAVLYENSFSCTTTKVKSPPKLMPLREQVQCGPSPAFAAQPFPFVLERVNESPEDYFTPAPLSVEDFQKSLATAALDVAQTEAVWSSSIGLISLALATDLPVQFQSRKFEEVCAEVEDKRKSLRDSTAEFSHMGKEEKLQNEKSELPPMTGRQAVELFVQDRHTGKITFVYLNISLNKHFRPYDLVVVPKSKVNPEHYVFSPFGVLHVYPDQSSDVLSLGEWHREAVIWKTIHGIPFFKYFLVRKVFSRWWKNVKLLKFWKQKNYLRNHLLPAVPHFGVALLQVSRLLQELKQVHWLPQNTSKCYTLTDFQQTLAMKNERACRLLEKFLTFCATILDMVREDSYEMVQGWQTQLQTTGMTFKNESLHQHRIQRETLLSNLRGADTIVQRLGNMAALVDHMITQNLITVVQEEVTNFVNQVMQFSVQPFTYVRTETEDEKLYQQIQDQQQTCYMESNENLNGSNTTLTNISSYDLTDNELSVLSKGLTFIPAQQADIPQSLLELKYFTRSLNLKILFGTSENTCSDLKQTSTFVPVSNPTILAFMKAVEHKLYTQNKYFNLTSAEFKALKILTNNSDIVIKNADKGTNRVAMDTRFYESKMFELLAFFDCMTICRSQATEIMAFISAALEQMYTDNHIDQDLYNYFGTDNLTIPIIYGVPKVHKSSICPLMKLIISARGWATESKYLEVLLKKFLPVTGTVIKDTADCIHHWSGWLSLNSSKDCMLATPDVDSLFTVIHSDTDTHYIRNAFLIFLTIPKIKSTLYTNFYILFLPTTFFYVNDNYINKLKMWQWVPLSPIRMLIS
ncbi:dynein heavy chain domain-containing protein 1 [Protopterus annectens]|uniref:dynein heavy chain domain-containing protein 1 n=1 Tax=Protopterus annectens TaxID=7888 RepID=UPI001CFA3121|nr:dynein heavy chain domain-containing protein 1 [Protopterus annectens]